MAQLVKHLTRGFGLGHDLLVMRLSLKMVSTLGKESA